jgi:hypothetical protein
MAGRSVNIDGSSKFAASTDQQTNPSTLLDGGKRHNQSIESSRDPNASRLSKKPPQTASSIGNFTDYGAINGGNSLRNS